MSEQRVAVVTGGAGGIGSACARHLASAGFAVALIDVQRAPLDEAVTALRSEGGKCTGLIADVTSATQLATAAETVGRDFGRIDVLLNIAGGGGFGRILELTPEAWSNAIASSLTGTFLSCRAFVGLMVAGGRGGAVVNMSSLVAFRHLPGRSAYSAAKAGIVAFTKVAADEWARHGIRVNALAPGYISTNATMSAIRRGLHIPSAIEDRTPLRRMGRPDEVAAAAAYLVSDDAAFITGQVLVIDGGYSAYGAWWPTSEDIPGLD